MEDLIREIHEDITGCRKLARTNYRMAYALYVLALLATVAATIISASDAEPWVRALVTAIPGIVVLANGTLKFQQKSRWYWHRVRLFEGLVRRLRYQGASVAEVSAEFTKLSQQLEDDWPGFDPLPAPTEEQAAAQQAQAVTPKR